jgi:hypothetical protein
MPAVPGVIGPIAMAGFVALLRSRQDARGPRRDRSDSNGWICSVIVEAGRMPAVPGVIGPIAMPAVARFGLKNLGSVSQIHGRYGLNRHYETL